MLSVVLFPDEGVRRGGLRDYFSGRSKLFYAILILFVLVDTMDTLVKGPEYYRRVYGFDYPIRQVLLAGGAAGGFFAKSERYHALFVVGALVFQVAWIISLFDVLG